MKAIIGMLFPILLSGCMEKPPDYFSGYAEAEYVRLGSPLAGTLTKVYVQRGDRVERNAPAFVLEQDNERAARAAAEHRVEQAKAQLANLEKSRRPDEIASIEAQLAQAEASLQLSSSNLARQTKLVADKFISPAALDAARAAVDRDQGLVNQLRAQLRLARLGARPDEIDAARQELKTAQAQLAQADWSLEQKTQRMPVNGDVDDVLYREGEWVPAGSPIVSLLPPQNIKVRFFVPETVVGALRLGQPVIVQCDGCKASIPAKISFVSSSPEYTSPLIYSTESRSTLVFMIEARPTPNEARQLHPGQPVEVRLAEGKS